MGIQRIKIWLYVILDYPILFGCIAKLRFYKKQKNNKWLLNASKIILIFTQHEQNTHRIHGSFKPRLAKLSWRNFNSLMLLTLLLYMSALGTLYGSWCPWPCPPILIRYFTDTGYGNSTNNQKNKTIYKNKTPKQMPTDYVRNFVPLRMWHLHQHRQWIWFNEYYLIQITLDIFTFNSKNEITRERLIHITYNQNSWAFIVFYNFVLLLSKCLKYFHSLNQ